MPRVLIIEDDHAISDMYVMRFTVEKGYIVEAAYNGQDGLAALGKTQPDVVLLDMMMPVMSGLEVLKKLRSEPGGKAIKVIALTNMNDPQTVAAIQKLGVSEHIVKAETTPGEVVNIVKKVLKK